ncbi:ATP-binding protein [Brachybacterium hainanense]|uniref:ATP-binding protein n=1 Tax=Brachybacterium hainanense TaxID=1541174 RepID=A0ABV6R6G8_9MICO
MRDQTFEEMIARIRRQATDDARVEVKTCAKKLSSDVWESVSAFANTAGGTILLGLTEATGFAPPAEGFAIDRVRDQFVEGIGDGGVSGVKLTNPPQYGMRREEVDGAPVLVITIGANPPGSRPCFLTARGLPGGAFKRVDDKDVQLSATEVYELRHELDPSSVDGQIVDEARVEDLDPELVRDLLLRMKDSRALRGAHTRDEQLSRVHLTDREGGVRFAGLLAAGLYPQQFFPRLLIDVTVHPGNEKSLPGEPLRFLDRVECTGNLVEAVNDAVSAVTRNLRTYAVVEGSGRRDIPEIPVVVLREAIANAVLHREYAPLFIGRPVTVDIFADRVEITSPGGLWGGKTLENLRNGVSSSRNQRLLPLMQRIAPEGAAGFTVEGQGSGILLMDNEMKAHALEKPRFQADHDQVRVTLLRHGAEVPEHRAWLRELTDRELSAHEDAALLIARRDGSVSAKALRTALRIDSDEARAILSSLRDEGVLRGRGKDSYALADGAPLPNDEDAAIIRGLTGTDPQSIHEIAAWSGLTLGTARARMRKLVDDGWVQATAPPQSRHRKYVVRKD